MKWIRKTTAFMFLVSAVVATACSPDRNVRSQPTTTTKMYVTGTTEMTATRVRSQTTIVVDTPTVEDKFTEVRYDSASWTVYPLDAYVPSHLAGLPNTATSIAIISAKKAWVGTYNGLWKYDDNKWSTYLEKDGMLSDSVGNIAIAPNGRIWVGSDRWVSSFDGQNWENFPFSGGIRAMNIALNGDVWIAQYETTTSPAALLDYSGKTWQEVIVGGESPNKSDDTNYVTSIATSADGAVWFGTMRNGIFRLDGKTWTHYPRNVFNGNFGENPPLVRDFAAAPDGTFWTLIGMMGGTAAQYDGRSWISYPFQSLDAALDAIAVSPKGRVWIGELFGRTISFMDGGKWYSFTNLPFNKVYDIQIAPDGSVWFATSGGLYIYKGK